MRPPLALTIAGSDADGAAGIQADLKTFTALGVYGASAVTTIGAVGTHGLRGQHYLPVEVITAQITAVLEDLHVDAVKIGSLGTAAAARAVAEQVRGRRADLGAVVLDPVMIASDGAPLLSAEGARALGEELVPLADVLTPNLREAAQLLGRPVARDVEEMREHALALAARGPRAVLVTGGGMPGAEAVDVLVHPGGTDVLRAERVPGRRVRGAGATLSAAITAQLARVAEFERTGELGEIGEKGAQDDAVTVIASALEFLASTIANARDWTVSRDPEGAYEPVNHLITLDGN